MHLRYTGKKNRNTYKKEEKLSWRPNEKRTIVCMSVHQFRVINFHGKYGRHLADKKLFQLFIVSYLTSQYQLEEFSCENQPPCTFCEKCEKL